MVGPMNSIIAVAAAALSAAAASPQATRPATQAAEGEIANPRGIVANFDAANLGPVLSEMGVVWQQRQTQEGRPYIAASIGGSLLINMMPTACTGPNFSNCVGLQTIALFPGKDINYQSVLAFGQKYAFTSVQIAPDASYATISRYDIADYGIARGNVASSLENFVYLASAFRQELQSGAKTISLKGYAEDFSATLLNSRGLTEVAGEKAGLPRHQEALEETAELINILYKEGEAPRNKIDNVTPSK